MPHFTAVDGEGMLSSSKCQAIVRRVTAIKGRRETKVERDTGGLTVAYSGGGRRGRGVVPCEC